MLNFFFGDLHCHDETVTRERTKHIFNYNNDVMNGILLNPETLLAAAALLTAAAQQEACPCEELPKWKPNPPRVKHVRCTCEETPLPRWGVAGCPPEDNNKVFGINVRVDEPRREDYCSRWDFERDHAKFDRLVDAAEACTWKNKSNTAPLHRVNAIRRRLEDGPVMGVNLVGETHWF